MACDIHASTTTLAVLDGSIDLAEPVTKVPYAGGSKVMLKIGNR